MPGISFEAVPTAGHAFFQEPDLQGLLGDNLLQGSGLTPQLFDLPGRCLAGRIAGEALLARLQELLRPTVIEALGDALATSQLGNAVLTAQAIQDNADLLLR
jgi:hypothetical protein